MARKNYNNTYDTDLYEEIQRLALILSAKYQKKIFANDLIEEGMKIIIDKYDEISPERVEGGEKGALLCSE